MPRPSPSPHDAARSLRASLRSLAQSDIQYVVARRSPSVSRAKRGTATLPPSARPSYTRAVIAPSAAALKLVNYKGERAKALCRLAEAVASCAKCGLCETRTQTVACRGNPNSPLMFVGEAPGADEDAQGLPFVGRAGKLLDDIIAKGMGYDPDQVFIANVLKCRPPNNRNPEPEEVAACRPFLDEQIRIVDPMVLVALGRFAAQWLLKSEEPIGKLRGKMWDADGRKVVATYHPAYLLRNPSAKREVWNDVQLVMEFLGRGKPLRMRS